MYRAGVHFWKITPDNLSFFFFGKLHQITLVHWPDFI
jgi:hypothetical protein